ncbi:MAG: hypothetical protein EAZ91_10785 [Cytophagales bacterium]|nr:MAG: hypothetical protein EAZ91_10785 [Cytophagales bacterium]
MKRVLLLLLTLSLLALRADEPVSKLNGAFRQVKNKFGTMTDWKPRDSVTVIKVFRDGYWLGAYYNDKRKGRRWFDGACGGTYALKNGKYEETVGYYSWDSTAVGKAYSFDYAISPKQYEQYGKMTSDKYKDYPINEVCDRITAAEPLKNNALEGVWFMQEGYWGGTSRFGEGNYKDFQVVKIFSYPMVVYAYYNPKTRQFDGAGGAMYQFDGKTLTETNEFWSWQPDGSRKGNVESFKMTLENGRFVQEGWSGKLREVYAKAN